MVYANEKCGEQCHIVQPYQAKAKTDESLLAFKHMVNYEMSCVDCHERNPKQLKHEQSVYESGEYEKPLYYREYKNEFCLKCHGDYDELIGRTVRFEQLGKVNPHRNHQRRTECSSCHRVHRRSRFTCSECHKSNWNDVITSGWQFAD